MPAPSVPYSAAFECWGAPAKTSVPCELCGGYQPLEPIAIAPDIPESASRQIVV